LVEVANSEAPDIVLLGGDLVDSRRGLDAIESCVRALAQSRRVAAVPGNHDVAVGLEDVRQRVLSAGGSWLSDERLVVRGARGALVRVCGRPSDTAHADVMNVACLHDPADARAASSAGFQVAFAGHLHGGQCVLFERQGRLYPGAWFNRWTGLRFSIGNLRLFVSLGLGDTLPLRLNCPHEVIVCDIAGS
jgi:predicted MPP superfamily phosphohydrolase